MGNMVKKEEYGTDKHILIANNSYMVTLPAVILQQGSIEDIYGKRIIKAGTPLSGNIKKRQLGFKELGLEETPSCILLHDVDVTDGDSNGTIVIAGVVDLLKLDEGVVSKIQANETKLPRIIFVEGSAI